MLGGLIEGLRKGDVKSFEEFYIVTYDTLYSYAWVLSGTQRDKAKELLIKTYCYVYDYRSGIPDEDKVYDWLYGQMNEAAKHHFDLTEDMIEEIKMQEEDYEAVIRLSEETASSILLMIEERLELLEEQEEVLSKKKKVFSGIKLVFACCLFAGTLWLLSVGVGQLTRQLSFLADPLVETLPDQIQTAETEEEKQNWIKIGNKLVFLSEVGQVLYSLPLEESDLDDKTPYNPEQQDYTDWIYYLPCPEREDSQLQLPEASPQLVHTLYRMDKQSGEWELVTREVDDYTVLDNRIYVEQYGRVQVLDELDTYEALTNRIIPEIREDGIYVYYLLGNPVPADEEGRIQIEDRLYNLEGNRVVAVTSAECKEGRNTWYLNQEEGILYQSINGQEQVFAEQGKQIDSFCRMGDWIYYSVYQKKSNAGRYYSQIFRKNMYGGAAESVTKEFMGNINKMYYSDESKMIIAEYVPESWISQNSLIAVLSQEGKLSTLELPDDTAAARGQSGLQFVISSGTDLYCLADDIPISLSGLNLTEVKMWDGEISMQAAAPSGQ